MTQASTDIPDHSPEQDDLENRIESLLAEIDLGPEDLENLEPEAVSERAVDSPATPPPAESAADDPEHDDEDLSAFDSIEDLSAEPVIEEPAAPDGQTSDPVDETAESPEEPREASAEPVDEQSLEDEVEQMIDTSVAAAASLADALGEAETPPVDDLAEAGESTEAASEPADDSDTDPSSLDPDLIASIEQLLTGDDETTAPEDDPASDATNDIADPTPEEPESVATAGAETDAPTDVEPETDLAIDEAIEAVDDIDTIDDIDTTPTEDADALHDECDEESDVVEAVDQELLDTARRLEESNAELAASTAAPVAASDAAEARSADPAKVEPTQTKRDDEPRLRVIVRRVTALTATASQRLGSLTARTIGRGMEFLPIQVRDYLGWFGLITVFSATCVWIAVLLR